MHKMVSGKLRTFVCLPIMAFILLMVGCHSKKTIPIVKGAILPPINRIVVVGFRAYMSKGEKPDVVRDPLSGSTFIAEPVPHEAVEKMTKVLFDNLLANKRYKLVSPGQAKGVFSSIVCSDLNVRSSPLKVLSEVGEAFRADAVLVGFIYRWRERDGTDYAINRPASVAFSLHLVRPTDGAVLWTRKFDKTQISLSENLFDLATFFEGRGRWMTVEKLAMLGLKNLIAAMPAETQKTEE